MVKATGRSSFDTDEKTVCLIIIGYGESEESEKVRGIVNSLYITYGCNCDKIE